MVNSATGRTSPMEAPLNREPCVRELVESFLTPLSIAYDRNHGPIPELSASDHTVKVHGKMTNPMILSLEDMQLMPQHSVVCTLQCAGNRRHTMRTSLKEVHGIDWKDAAVMNCEWRGPLLRDVLLKAGVEQKEGRHVEFSTRAQECQDDERYGASIPLSRAMDADAEAILALEMNGVPLPTKHGAPVRVIIPGIIGARCVKWLEEIYVQDQESQCYYQQKDYKVLPPEATDVEVAKNYWHKTPSLQEMPLNSVVGFPESESKVERFADGTVEVVGYALPSGKGAVIKMVQVSTDDGQTWADAKLLWGEGTAKTRWCWCLWTAKVKIEKGTNKKILSRAMDAHGVWQERTSQWNLRGVAYCGYGEAHGLEIV